MRALVFDGPWELTVADRPDPQPAPGEALLRIIATGICGSDIHGFTGQNGRRHPEQVMGHETAAQVVAINPGDRQLPSDLVEGTVVTINPVLGCGACAVCLRGQPQRCANRRVIGVDPQISAAMAEYMTAPLSNIVSLAEGLIPELGALVEPLSVGWHAVCRGAVGADDRVLIQGAGPIGQAAALGARRAGAARIVVSEPDHRRRAVIAEMGFGVIDPTTVPAGKSLAGIQEPFDVVIDGVGTSQTMETALISSALGARIVLVGMHTPHLELPAYAISTAERTILGSFCYQPDEFAATAAWVGERGNALLPLVEGRVDLDGAAEAFRTLADGSKAASKVLIFPHGVSVPTRTSTGAGR